MSEPKQWNVYRLTPWIGRNDGSHTCQEFISLHEAMAKEFISLHEATCQELTRQCHHRVACDTPFACNEMEPTAVEISSGISNHFWVDVEDDEGDGADGADVLAS